jgi:PAS domain-containing protein
MELLHVDIIGYTAQTALFLCESDWAIVGFRDEVGSWHLEIAQKQKSTPDDFLCAVDALKRNTADHPEATFSHMPSYVVRSHASHWIAVGWHQHARESRHLSVGQKRILQLLEKGLYRLESTLHPISESERVAAQCVSHCPVPTALITPQGIVTEINKSMARYIGKTREMMIGLEFPCHWPGGVERRNSILDAAARDWTRIQVEVEIRTQTQGLLILPLALQGLATTPNPRVMASLLIP